MAAVDLYLCNRAPDLYTNYKALELLLMEKASRWDTHFTDLSLLEVVRKLSKTLRGYKLPAAISAALDKLDFIIKNFTDYICDSHHALHPEDWDLLTDVDFSDNEEASDEDNLLDEDDRLVDQLLVVHLHIIRYICPRSLTVMQDYLSELPQEIVDWDPQLISINTNGISNSHRYILQQLSSCHDVTFIQETRFRSPSEHSKVDFYWQREGMLFFKPPIYPEVPMSPATGGLATLIYPHSPLKDAVETPHHEPILRGRYLQVRCQLGGLTIVLHNVYAPEAWSDRAAFFVTLPRDFPPHILHIAGGDFNCILNKDLDSLKPSAATME
ncbi:Aste57867_2342 [Aphanomyces stellatus]|uniref:Aste57867_2342 protein n=1 Tax=Aphanomyces stellatus TaxID=120398 RepID=A0A485K8F1_9STRA|nr:hypothetical protein As57867_002337 [Aphanomyces stellatus]VFT79544.1 Aste57867_2342 [Aphanomyces stellatus]